MSWGISLLGFGNVNRELVKLLDEYNTQKGSNYFQVIAVADKKFGSVYKTDGIPLMSLFQVPDQNDIFSSLPGGSKEFLVDMVLGAPEVDVVCEAIFTNPTDGEPALSYCKTALSNGKNVATTNKGPIAFGLNTLIQISEKHSVKLAYEGTVMSGTPAIHIAKSCFPATRFESFEGVLNGTANFVLGRVESGVSMLDAIIEAQALAYAEADPTADIEGSDVMLKVMILSEALFSKTLTPSQISCEGISNLSELEIRQAVKDGFRWKLVGKGIRTPSGSFQATVAPECLPLSHPLSAIQGADNALCLREPMLGAVTIVGPGAGRRPTAYALLADIQRITQSTAKA